MGLNKYRDNNNFIRKNKVLQMDDRWNIKKIMKGSNKTTFVDILKALPWVR